MEDRQLKEIAAQLAQPSGDKAGEIAVGMNKGNAFISARAIEALASESGEWIAEIGPGNGILSIPVIKAIGDNGHYIGMELSQDMALQTSENLDQLNQAKITILVGDSLSASIERNTLNGLFAVNVLYFIDDLQALFNCIAGWLKPGGRVVFGVRSDKALSEIPFTRFCFRIRPLEEIVDALNSSGFEAVETAYYDEGTESILGLDINVDSLIIKATVR